MINFVIQCIYCFIVCVELGSFHSHERSLISPLFTNVKALSLTHDFVARSLCSLHWPWYSSELFTHNYIDTFPPTFYPLSLGLLSIRVISNTLGCRCNLWTKSLFLDKAHLRSQTYNTSHNQQNSSVNYLYAITELHRRGESGHDEQQ